MLRVLTMHHNPENLTWLLMQRALKEQLEFSSFLEN